MKNKFKPHKLFVKDYFLKYVFLIFAVFLGVSFFVWTLYPYMQMARFFKDLEAAISGDLEKLMDSNFSFKPYTHVQPAIRYKLITTLFRKDQEGTITEKHIPIIKFAIEKMKEVIDIKNNQPFYVSSIAKAYDQLAELDPLNSGKYRGLAEDYYKKAISISPNNYNQDARFSYSINLIGQGRVNEAVDLMRQTVAYDVRPAQPHYFLGLALFNQGRGNWVEALNELEYSLNKKYNPFNDLSVKVYSDFMNYFYNKKDIKNLIIVVDRLASIDQAQSRTYMQLSEFMKQYNRIPFIDFTY
jgi:tetratricopeptide (TPR) repeat protein